MELETFPPSPWDRGSPRDRALCALISRHIPRSCLPNTAEPPLAPRSTFLQGFWGALPHFCASALDHGSLSQQGSATNTKLSRAAMPSSPPIPRLAAACLGDITHPLGLSIAGKSEQQEDALRALLGTGTSVQNPSSQPAVPKHSPKAPQPRRMSPLPVLLFQPHHSPSD